MQIHHVITLDSRSLTDGQIRAAANRLKLLGLLRDPEPLLLLNFKISETDPRWPDAQALLRDYPAALDVTSTTFTRAELAGSPWLFVNPQWHHGYPMPDADLGYLQATYDLSEHCEACGIGATQAAEFRMRREPRWGRRSILQLNWVFDEYFVTPDLWTLVFEPHRVPCRPVLHHRTLQPLSTVVQLCPIELAPCSPPLTRLPQETCMTCGRSKYLPHVRGYFPSVPACEGEPPLVKSAEFFGSGASAHRSMFMSQRLYQDFAESKAKGIHFTAVCAAAAA